jgi:hypothetical protein
MHTIAAFGGRAYPFWDIQTNAQFLSRPPLSHPRGIDRPPRLPDYLAWLVLADPELATARHVADDLIGLDQVGAFHLQEPAPRRLELKAGRVG